MFNEMPKKGKCNIIVETKSNAFGCSNHKKMSQHFKRSLSGNEKVGEKEHIGAGLLSQLSLIFIVLFLGNSVH